MSEDPDFDMEVVENDELDEMGADGASSLKEHFRSETSREESDTGTGETDDAESISSRPGSVGADSDREVFGLGSVPEEWNISSLPSVVEIEMGSSPPSSTYNEQEEGLPFYQGNADFGHMTPKVSTWCSDPVKTAEEDDVLISIRAPVGDLNIADEHCCIGRGLAALRPDKVNGLYLFHGLAQRSRWLSRLASGSTFKSVSSADLEKVDLPVPSLPEQRKIASVLYAVDQAIQKTEAIIEQAKRVKRGAERKLFRRGYYQHGVSEKRLTVLPTDWKFEPLEEHTQSSAFGPRFSGDLYDDDGNVAVLRTTDLDSQGRITHETMPRAALDLQEIEDHIVEKGDLLITRSGTTGITTVWDGYRIPVIPGAFLIRFRLSQSVDPSFLKYYINSDVGGRRVDRRAKGGVQKNLAGSDLLNMRFPIPPMEEQEEIVKVLDGFDAQITQEKNLRDRLQSLKKGLMQDLLTGEVRTMGKAIEVLGEVKAHG